MSRTTGAICAAILISLAAPAAFAQPFTAGPAPCRALEVRPDTPESYYHCVYPSGWSSIGDGYAQLTLAPATWFGVNWDQARFDFRDGKLKEAIFWWTGDLATIDGWLRSRYGAPRDTGHQGYFIYRYPDTANGWQVTLSGGPTQWGVNFRPVRDLWR